MCEKQVNGSPGEMRRRKAARFCDGAFGTGSLRSFQFHHRSSFGSTFLFLNKHREAVMCLRAATLQVESLRRIMNPRPGTMPTTALLLVHALMSLLRVMNPVCMETHRPQLTSPCLPQRRCGGAQFQGGSLSPTVQEPPWNQP